MIVGKYFQDFDHQKKNLCYKADVYNNKLTKNKVIQLQAHVYVCIEETLLFIMTIFYVVS